MDRLCPVGSAESSTPHARRVAGFAIVAAGGMVLAESVGVLAAGKEWTGVAQVAGVLAISAALPATIAAASGITLAVIRSVSLAFHRSRFRKRGLPTADAVGRAAGTIARDATERPEKPSALLVDPATGSTGVVARTD